MFTLFILITMDGWIEVFQSLRDAFSFEVAALYCGIFVAIGGFVFVNILVAVVVTNLEETYEHMKRSKRAKLQALKARLEPSLARMYFEFFVVLCFE